MERVNGGEDPDPSGYYFRTAPGFEAPDGEYEWLNKLVAFAVGRRRAIGVTYAVYALSWGAPTARPGDARSTPRDRAGDRRGPSGR